MDKKANKHFVLFFSLLCFITFMAVGSILNTIVLHMIVNQVKADGMDYDAFREMKLSKKVIDSLEEGKASQEPVFTKGEHESEWDAMDLLTLSMMIHQYDLEENVLIDKKNVSYLLNYLKSGDNYKELKTYYSAILKDSLYFPIWINRNQESFITFDNSWNSYRSYGGNRRHEGTDLMPKENKRGYYKVLSMSEGIVEKLGWLEQGGYRVGIRSSSGIYYYYAHLDSYAPGLAIGDTIKGGQFIGYMGDSGYGKEGTTGMFLVHLHVGIYVETTFGELSINPYWLLRYLEND